MMNRSLLYDTILTQIRERQKKLSFLRNLIMETEEAGKPAQNLKRNISSLLAEIKNLQDKIRQFPPLRKLV